MATKKRQSGVEWVGGIVEMPALVQGEGVPFRPDMLVWLGRTGAVLGHEMGEPGSLPGVAAASLRATIARPLFGRPHTPRLVRVASAELAKALSGCLPDVEIVCAPTPEIDDMAQVMRSEFGRSEPAPTSFLAGDITSGAMGALFSAAEELYRAKPWVIVPGDSSVFTVSCDALGLEEAAVSIIGQMGESYGFILFANDAAFDAFLDGSVALQNGGSSEAIPAHLALNFERGADLVPELRKEVSRYHWKVAGPKAYPCLTASDAGLRERAPTMHDLTIVEAISRSFPEVLLDRDALEAAWDGDADYERVVEVPTFAGPFELTWRLLGEEQAATPADILADMAELEGELDEADEAYLGELTDELLQQFERSEEAKTVADTSWCRCLLDLTRNYLGVTVATLGSREFERILFELVPRQVSVPAEEAGNIIQCLRGFYRYLERQFGLEQAQGCLALLTDKATSRLSKELSNPKNFGMAKSLVMAGKAAGYDVSSPEGLEAWMRVANGAMPNLPSGLGLGGSNRPTVKRPVDRAKKKQQRKAVQKARKKNR